MENVRVLCEKMVEDNVNGNVDPYVKDLLTIAVMAIVLDHEEVALKKLPIILKRLNIYAEDKSVLDIAHDSLGNFYEDDELRDADASATRSLSIDDENNTVEEHLNLLISLTDVEKKDATKMIEKTINGLIHFMRFGKINVTDSNLLIKDGICTINYDKKTGKTRKKHFILESGVSQFYTLSALGKLYSFVENEDDLDNELLKKFKSEYLLHEPTSFMLPVTVIQLLCDDKHFKDLLDTSFEDFDGPAKIALYYNDVMKDGSAFTFLSKQIDSCSKEISNGNDERAVAIIENIKSDVSRFRKDGYAYKKY